MPRSSARPLSPGRVDNVVSGIWLDALLAKLRRQGRIVDMKFFGEFTEPEIAEVLGISSATVKRDWSVARVWLRTQMAKSPPGAP